MNNTSSKCLSCDLGILIEGFHEYRTVMEDGTVVLIPDLKASKCNVCGSFELDSEAIRRIDVESASASDRLSPKDIKRIRERLGIADQEEMSHILGLGAKTFHRWEKGSQYPSRSMCHYLRTLEKFPDAFIWLQKAPWKSNSQPPDDDNSISLRNRFPDLARERGEIAILAMLVNPATNPALIFCGGGN